MLIDQNNDELIKELVKELIIKQIHNSYSDVYYKLVDIFKDGLDETYAEILTMDNLTEIFTPTVKFSQRDGMKDGEIYEHGCSMYFSYYFNNSPFPFFSFEIEEITKRYEINKVDYLNSVHFITRFGRFFLCHYNSKYNTSKEIFDDFTNQVILKNENLFLKLATRINKVMYTTSEGSREGRAVFIPSTLRSVFFGRFGYEINEVAINSKEHKECIKVITDELIKYRNNKIIKIKSKGR